MAYQLSILLAFLVGFQFGSPAHAKSSSGTAPQYSNGSISTTIKQTQVSYRTKVVSAVGKSSSTNAANGMSSSGTAPQTINGSMLTTRGPTLDSQTLIRYQKTRIGSCAPCMILASEDGRNLLSKVIWYETPISVTVDTVTADVTKYNHTTITSFATNHGDWKNLNFTIEAELRAKLTQVENGRLNIKNYYEAMGNFVRANGTDGDIGNGVTSIAYPTPYVGIRGFILFTSLANNTDESCQMTSAFSAANPERQGGAPEVKGLGSTTIMLDNTYYSPLRTLESTYTDLGRKLFAFAQYVVMTTEPWKAWLDSNTALASQYPMLSDCLHAEFAFGPPAFKLPVTAMTATTTKITSQTGALPAPGNNRIPQMAPPTPVPVPETPDQSDEPAQPDNSRQRIEPPSANPPIAQPPNNPPDSQPQNGGAPNNPVTNSPEPQNQGSPNSNPPSLPGQGTPNQGSSRGTNNQNPSSVLGQGTPNQGAWPGSNNQGPPNSGSSPGSQNQNFPNLGLTPGTNDQNSPPSPGQGTPNQNPSPDTNEQGSPNIADLLESLDQGSANAGSSPGSKGQGSSNTGSSPGFQQGSPNVGNSPESPNQGPQNSGPSPESQNQGSPNGPGAVVPNQPTYQTFSAAEPVWTVAGTAFTPVPAADSGYVIAGQTLAPGGSIMVDNAVVSYPRAGGGVVVAEGGNGGAGSDAGTGLSTGSGTGSGSENGNGANGENVGSGGNANGGVVNNNPPATIPINQPVWTLGETPYTPVPTAGSAFVIADQTLSPGSSITVEGAVISLPTSGDSVIVQGPQGAHGGAGANNKAAPIATIPTSQPVWTLGGTPYTPTPTGSAFVIADQTLSPGSSITVDGAVVSLPTSGGSVIVQAPQAENAGNAALATIPTTQSIWTLGGIPYTPTPTGSAFVIAGQTLSPGSSITVNNAILSLPTSGGSIIVQSGAGADNLIPQSTLPVTQSVWTLNGTPYIPTPTSGSAYIIAGQTLSPGSSITVNGEILSYPSNSGVIVVGTNTGTTTGTGSGRIIPTSSANATASSTDGLGNIILDGFGAPSTSPPPSTPTTGAENSALSLLSGTMKGRVAGIAAAALGFVWIIGVLMT